MAAAEAGKLVTFGVVPDRPETGYGYIRRAKGEGPAYPVAEFVEKPDLDTAVRYVQSGEYFWNSGMFMFRARAYPGRAGAARAGDAGGLRGGGRGGEARPRFHAPRRRRVRRLPERFDRLCGDGEDQRRRWSCRSTPAGATWARGPRCRTRCRATQRATSPRAT